MRSEETKGGKKWQVMRWGSMGGSGHRRGEKGPLWAVGRGRRAVRDEAAARPAALLPGSAGGHVPSPERAGDAGARKTELPDLSWEEGRNRGRPGSLHFTEEDTGAPGGPVA